MNKKAQANIFVALMLGILFFLVGLAVAPALTEVSDEARSSSNLDCANSSISDQDKAICVQVDVMTPFFVGIIFGLAGLLIGRVII